MRTVLMIKHELWPLEEIDTKKEKFPYCLVRTPLPVVSWLAPFIGHIGICRHDGVILDFSGSNFVNLDNFSIGSVVSVVFRRTCSGILANPGINIGVWDSAHMGRSLAVKFEELRT